MMFVRRSAEAAYAASPGDAADKMVGSNEGRSNINKHAATCSLEHLQLQIARDDIITVLNHFRTMVDLSPIISIIPVKRLHTL